MRPLRIFGVLLVWAVLVAAPVRADEITVKPSEPVVSSWLMGSPQGPSRSFGILPSGLFDPSKLSISNTLRFGASSGGPMNGTAGLFTSSLGYRLKPNMALSVDVGAHINPAYGYEGMSKGVFLQGAAFSWKPSANSLFRVEYQDLRSPLQYGYSGYGYAPYAGFGGYNGYRSPFVGSPTDPLLDDPSRN